MSGPMWICAIVIGIHRRQVLRPACLAVITLVLSTAVAPAQPPQQNAAGEAGDAAVFRPVAGSFPPLERAVTYRGELVFVDHANRRGSLRVQGSGMFFRNDPHPFALLPYAVVRYRTAPADLRDVPLGTVMHAHAFLPPDPLTSSVPVLPLDSGKQDANHNRGAGIFPAENHVLLLEDDPSHCRRLGLTWRLTDIEIRNLAGSLTAVRESATAGAAPQAAETLTFDAATRVWRGRELLSVEELVEEQIWPSEGKRSLEMTGLLLGITWRPTPDGVFTRFHVSDIWLDEAAMQRAAKQQTEVHRAFIRSRWMPAWIDRVEYGKFGRARVTATLFGGMDESLYADFRTGDSAMINAVEATLKHTHGAYGPAHMASRGTILSVTRSETAPPLGSSGVQIQFETDLIIEGIRAGRTVRIRPGGWPLVQVPREEYLNDGVEERFPRPDIFPKY